MAIPSLQDLQAPFDPTSYPNITQAELLQLITGAFPASDSGMIKVTSDIGGVPQVPDAVNVIKWQNYLWVRVQASSVVVYVWNANGAVDATFQRWVPITVASIGDNTIITRMIQNLQVTDDKIASVSINKITGFPTGLPPTGAAGGDLTGNYPNPTIGPNTVTSSKLQSDAVVDANRAVGTNHIQNYAVDFATKLKVAGTSALQLLRVNAGGTAWEAFTKLLTQLPEPVTGNANQSIRVKADASGFEYGASLVQVVNTTLPAIDSSIAVIPYDNTPPQNTEGKSLITVSITPKKAGNWLRIRFNCFVGAGGAYRTVLSLFADAGTDAIQATASPTLSASDVCPISIERLTTAPDTSAHSFTIRYGPSTAGTAYINQSGTTTLFGSSAVSGNFTVEEIEPT